MVKSKNSASFAYRANSYELVLKPRTVYRKPRWRLTDNERAGIGHLESNGIFPTVLDEDPDAPANFDLDINGDLYEMKNVTNSGSSVSNQVGRAREKWWKSGLGKPWRVIFTTEGATEDFDVIADAIFARMKADEVFIVISQDGMIREKNSGIVS